MTNDENKWSVEARRMANPETGFPFMEGMLKGCVSLGSNVPIIRISDDLYMHSRYVGYSMWIKSIAFLPCIIGFIVFFTLVAVYGRISGTKSNAAKKTIEV